MAPGPMHSPVPPMDRPMPGSDPSLPPHSLTPGPMPPTGVPMPMNSLPNGGPPISGSMPMAGGIPPPHAMPMVPMGPMMSGPPGHHMPPPRPYMGQPDYRIFDLNKRLAQRCESMGLDQSENLWWDAFATEFFEDDAILTLQFCLEDGLKRYTIGRTLIPRYFRSIFEGGVTDLYFVVKKYKESFHNTTITLDCDQAFQVTHHGQPLFTKVVTEGRLLLEFTCDDMMRIRSWNFSMRNFKEFIPRNVIAMQQQDAGMMEQLTKNITRQGLTNYTLNFLRLCVILEPMQELMSRHKAYGLNPRDCLKTTLFQKWQRMVAPPASSTYANEISDKAKKSSRQPNKRRKRKSSAGAAGTPGGSAGSRESTPKQKRSPGPQGFTPGDVMVVGEPTLMGGEFGDEDERLITRLENNQFEPENSEIPTSAGVSPMNSPWPTGAGNGGGGGNTGNTNNNPGNGTNTNGGTEKKAIHNDVPDIKSE